MKKIHSVSISNLNVLLRIWMCCYVGSYSSNDGRGAAISWQSRATPSKHRSPARFQVISPFPISIPFAQLYVLLPRTLGSWCCWCYLCCWPCFFASVCLLVPELLWAHSVLHAHFVCVADVMPAVAVSQLCSLHILFWKNDYYFFNEMG